MPKQLLSAKALLKERQRLLNLRGSLPIALKHIGHYDREASASFHIYELQELLNQAMCLVDWAAETTGWGDINEQARVVMNAHNEYLTRYNRFMSTGKDWDIAKMSCGSLTDDEPRRKTKAPPPVLGDGVFGMTWEQIGAKQGGGRVS